MLDAFVAGNVDNNTHLSRSRSLKCAAQATRGHDSEPAHGPLSGHGRYLLSV